MIYLSPSEQNMWDTLPKEKPKGLNLSQINEKYEKGEQRIVTEMNREKLPNFVDALERLDYMEVRPFYQRRSRWDEERQSKLIESFIINIPVPPVFLYEKSFNSYEVMDGQQRITAIQDFYKNKFSLRGLDLWPELNGMKYSDLPNKIRSGLDRRSISSIVLLKESAPDEQDAVFLRQLVFERLNTGGVKLERQEIRNSLSTGHFNDMLYELARHDLFRHIWGLPKFVAEELTNHKMHIYESSFFKKMEDLEVVLRFFALRHMKHFRYGIQGFLDLYMIRSKNFDKHDVEYLKNLYISTLELAYDIYGDNIFRIYEDGEWKDQPIKGLYDAIMVPLSEFVENEKKIRSRAELIIRKTIELMNTKGAAAITGRASTKADLVNRIQMFREIFQSSIRD